MWCVAHFRMLKRITLCCQVQNLPSAYFDCSIKLIKTEKKDSIKTHFLQSFNLKILDIQSARENPWQIVHISLESSSRQCIALIWRIWRTQSDELKYQFLFSIICIYRDLRACLQHEKSQPQHWVLFGGDSRIRQKYVAFRAVIRNKYSNASKAARHADQWMIDSQLNLRVVSL